MSESSSPNERYAVCLPVGKLVTDEALLLPMTAVSILQFVRDNKEATYEEVSDATGIPLNSLYVCSQRLYANKLIKKRAEFIDGRERTVLSAGIKVHILQARILSARTK